MKKMGILFLASAILIYSCKENSKKTDIVVQERDTTITVHNAFNNLFLDSTVMESFIAKQSLHDSLAKRLRNFYNGRNYEYAWFSENGMADYVNTVLSLQNQYIDYAKDSSLYNASLQKLVDSLAIAGSDVPLADSTVQETELLLSTQFFRYSWRAYQGNRLVKARELDWFIPSKKINSVAFLDSLLKNKGKNLTQYEPVNRQYNLLKNYLLKYYEAQKNGGWQPVVATEKAYRPGDSSEVIRSIKRRLLFTKDLKKEDTTDIFNDALTEAVKSYQRRYGLKEDGVVGPAFFRQLNEPVDKRIQQILVNMERLRWVPEEPKSDYLLVNIPEFRLHVYEKGNYAWNMNVVVGSTAHSSVIFSGVLQNIVFSPYWYVPPGILKKEILPGIRRSSSYLARHNMEWHNGQVRQKPGRNNSLGLVKFLFPNSYNIYLHDTPSKSLFTESKRAFSHGCIRLSEPAKLAAYLLRKDTGWTAEKINKAMHSGKEQYVKVTDTIPVFIGYFTAWVDRDGKLNFREDIYKHDEKMAKKLFAAR